MRYANASGTASIALEWRTGASAFALVPGASLKPGYGLTTTEINADGEVTASSYVDAPADIGPEDRLIVSETRDPSGLALTSSNTYEASGLRRQTASLKPLGAASSTTTTYYGPTATATVPCSGGASNVPQVGQTKLDQRPDPTGSGTNGIAQEVVYNAQGQVAASRVVADGSNWACVSYDSRGRATTAITPTLGSRPGRTTTNAYSVSGNPLVRTKADQVSGGSTLTETTTVDLLGRERTFVDVWGNSTTTAYDQAGRPTSIASAGGTQTLTYDSDGNEGATVFNGTTLATPHYDTAGRLEWVEYANGVRSSVPTTDSLSRATSLEWKMTSSGTSLYKETASYSLGERVTNLTTDGFDPRSAGDDYLYDGAGRLTEAWTTSRDSSGVLSSRHVAYGFGTASGSCAGGTQPNAGKNTNRTSQTVGDGGSAVTTSYCYNAADQMVSTTEAGVGSPTYDNHGNTTQIWSETRGYDASDRHASTAKGSTVVSYDRDAIDRIVQRTVTVSGSVTSRQRLGYTNSTGSSSFVQSASGTLVEATVSLPGNSWVTIRGAQQVWSLPNTLGSVALTTDASGVPIGQARSYDPFGNLTGVAAPLDNADGSFDYAWDANSRTATEHEGTLAITLEMGARQYDPVLGRFLQIDPVAGGSANDYVYVHGDPMNSSDPTGAYTKSRISFNVPYYICNPWWCKKVYTHTVNVGWKYKLSSTESNTVSAARAIIGNAIGWSKLDKNIWVKSLLSLILLYDVWGQGTGRCYTFVVLNSAWARLIQAPYFFWYYSGCAGR